MMLKAHLTGPSRSEVAMNTTFVVNGPGILASTIERTIHPSKRNIVFPSNCLSFPFTPGNVMYKQIAATVDLNVAPTAASQHNPDASLRFHIVECFLRRCWCTLTLAHRSPEGMQHSFQDDYFLTYLPGSVMCKVTHTNHHIHICGHWTLRDALHGEYANMRQWRGLV